MMLLLLLPKESLKPDPVMPTSEIKAATKFKIFRRARRVMAKASSANLAELVALLRHNQETKLKRAS